MGRFSGGVGCYVRLDIASTLEIMVNFSNGVVELLTLYSRVNNLYIAIIYRQPDDRMGNHRSTEKEFQEAIDKLNSSLSNLPSPCPNIVHVPLILALMHASHWGIYSREGDIGESACAEK